jgi:DNA-binding NarL/FixJ family response regulator
VGVLRVVVADDHRLMLDSIELALEQTEEIEVVGTAGSGVELLSLVARLAPDVVLLDIGMPAPDGLACLEAIRTRHPRVISIVLSGSDEPRVARQALQLGAKAYVRKHIDPRDLAAVIRQTVEETVVSTLESVDDAEDEVRATRGMLTTSELAVFDALIQGHANKRIAGELSIAQQTVKFHLTNIYRKLGVSNRSEAIRYAYDHGLIESGALVYA